MDASPCRVRLTCRPRGRSPTPVRRTLSASRRTWPFVPVSKVSSTDRVPAPRGICHPAPEAAGRRRCSRADGGQRRSSSPRRSGRRTGARRSVDTTWEEARAPPAPARQDRAGEQADARSGEANRFGMRDRRTGCASAPIRDLHEEILAHQRRESKCPFTRRPAVTHRHLVERGDTGERDAPADSTRPDPLQSRTTARQRPGPGSRRRRLTGAPESLEKRHSKGGTWRRRSVTARPRAPRSPAAPLNPWLSPGRSSSIGAQ